MASTSTRPEPGSRSPRHGLAPPALDWIRDYKPAWLRRDVVAGVTLAAYIVPSAIADASLANLPPQAGLYACLFAGLFFWFFCSSRHTAISVTSAISLLIGASLGELAGGDPVRFASLAAGVALLVAAMAFVAWVVRAGGIVNFISESVMVGFKCAWRCSWRARSSPSSSGCTAVTATFGSGVDTFSLK